MDNTLLGEGEETSRQAEQVDNTSTGEVEHTLDSLRVDLAADQDTTEAGCKLSQGDLVLCLSKLNDQIHSLKGQVYDAIGQSYEEFIQTFDNAVHVEKAIAELTDGLAAVTQQIEDPHTGIHAALVKPALELEHITQQAALTGELIQTVTVLNQLNDRLCAFTQAMDAFTLPAAARLTREIGKLLRQLPTEDQDTRDVPAVFIAVKKRHRRRCERLKARLGALVRQALTFETTSLSYSLLLTVHLSSQEEGKQVVTVPLADIFEAMDNVDEEGAPDQRFLEREMEEFVCHALRTGVLHFILAHAFSGQAWEVRVDEAEHKRIYLAEKQHAEEAASERAHDAKSKSERAVSVDNLFGVLGAFFGLLSSQVFAHDKQRLALLGHLLWEPLCRDIIAKVLSPAIPSDTAKLAQYQRETIQSTEKFEEVMVALGLVPASAAGGPDDTHSDNDHHQPPPAEARRLSRFINNVDNHFAAKKQKKILNRARNLLLNQEANVCLKEVCTANMLPDVSSFLTVNATAGADAITNADKRRQRRQSAMRASAGAGSGGGVDDVDVDENEEEGLRRIATQSKKGECHDAAAGDTPQTDDRVFIFQMPTCQVSASTIGLVVLAHHTLEEACRLRDSAPQCAHTLQQTARDLFDLYRAIMPLQYQKETIKSVPSLAMAFHNDCFYLALQLLTLGMQYQDRLPKDKGRCAFTLVDLVPVFRQLGEKQYQQQVEKQQAVLKETVQSAQGLADTHLRVRFMTVERAMKRVVHHLTHLSRDVLPRHVYLRTVGQLLDVALEDLIASFEKLEDISEEETHHLHELLSLLLDCSSFFTATAAADEGGGGEGEGEGEGGQAVLAESGREEETKRHARRWSKFVKIVNMLESKLVVIVDAYVKGLMPEFEPEELKAIIRALFSDSPLRKSQLALIK